LRQAAKDLRGPLRGRGLTQGQALQTPVRRVPSVVVCGKFSKKTGHGKRWVKIKTTNQRAKTMNHPKLKMRGNEAAREQMLALFENDEALKNLRQKTVQEVMETEMNEALGACKGERTE
jgi:hypothetical protein